MFDISLQAAIPIFIGIVILSAIITNRVITAFMRIRRYNRMLRYNRRTKERIERMQKYFGERKASYEQEAQAQYYQIRNNEAKSLEYEAKAQQFEDKRTGTSKNVDKGSNPSTQTKTKLVKENSFDSCGNFHKQADKNTPKKQEKSSSKTKYTCDAIEENGTEGENSQNNSADLGEKYNWLSMIKNFFVFIFSEKSIKKIHKENVSLSRTAKKIILNDDELELDIEVYHGMILEYNEYVKRRADLRSKPEEERQILLSTPRDIENFWNGLSSRV